MKTIEEWLSMLPLDLYLLAVGYTDYNVLNVPKPSFKLAVEGAFVWDDTNEGLEFWQQLATRDEYWLRCFEQMKYYV